MSDWKVGQVKITKILERQTELALDAILIDIPEASTARYPWLVPDHLVDDQTGRMAIQGFVVDTGEFRILVDTCVGEHQNPIPMGDSPFLDQLAEAGYRPEDIDYVVCTHLHFDHVGWNTRLVDGRWVVTFPNARYLFGRVEWDHWSIETGPYLNVDETVRPVLEAGQADLVEVTHQVCAQVRFVPTPGHTPGHVSVVIESEGEQAVITGDMAHHPLQFADPAVGSNADSDPARAAATRRSRLAEWAADRTLVIGTHFVPPTAGRLQPDGEGWRIVG
jgi:glyoxylase-like metal-dependent hydrolase (beta-lactamase superfamily II)